MSGDGAEAVDEPGHLGEASIGRRAEIKELGVTISEERVRVELYAEACEARDGVQERSE